MIRLVKTLGKALTTLALWLSHISLRGVVAILGLAFTLSLPRNDLFDDVDEFFLQLGSYLFSSPSAASDIAIITVPKEELSIWQSDIHSSGKLAALLSNILESSSASVGLLLQQPMDVGSGAADALIERYAEKEKRTEYDVDAKALVDRKYILMDLLGDRRVTLGVERFAFAGQKPLLVDKPFIGEIPLWVQDVVWPVCNTCFTRQEGVVVGRPKFEQHTLVPINAPYHQMVYRSDAREAYPGFLLAMLRSMSKVPAEENLEWKGGDTIAIGGFTVHLSPGGRLIPLYGLTQRMAPIVSEMSLQEALASGAFPEVVIIAQDNSLNASAVAAALYSVQKDGMLYTPWWGMLALMLLMLVITLYLSLIVSRIGLARSVVVSAIFGVVVITAQTYLLVAKAMWLPIAFPLVWLSTGLFLLLIWKIKKQRVLRVVSRADDICIERARELMEEKSLNDALAQLKDCSVREPLLQTLYDISEAYTEQKDYQNAVAILAGIKNKKKSFKDTEQKLQVLTTMVKTMSDEETKEALQKTTVIQPGQQQQILGRYELEREIGRGATGKVYLGFDPKIARKVAVKTLNYDNFQGKEKEEIKSRFFREAEAAGRLSHPAIVSVFDVGEEGDMAFIAMDFAEGKALNNFVEPDNLLPVFEVYRIALDVATALQYAHENNIVHRDVKPGNIIYNPSPYQIKVTDFGIARLVDDSKTSTGEILGSPLYMAPEQLKGKKVNYSADIFSLGVTFYQLLTGKLPYSGENLASLTYEIIHGKHKPARTVRKDLPASASRITNQALQKDPEDRYESAAEMALVLKKAIKRDFSAEAKKMGII